MPTTPPSITALPTPPDPNDRSTFNTRAYPWSVAQQTLATEVGAVADNVFDNATDAETAAGAAETKATEASASADAAALSEAAAEDARDMALVYAGLAGAAAGLPALAGHGGHIMRANSAETGVEWFDPDTSAIVAVAALNIDCSLGGYFTKTIAGNSTFTFSNAPAGLAYAFTLELTHTSGTVAWPASVRWPNGAAPALTTGKVHLFMFLTDDGGATWRAASCVNYAS